MSEFTFDTGFGDVDSFFGLGSGTMPVYQDNAYGGQDEQPYTPVGNGSGQWFDQSAKDGIFGLLTTGLNYALYRDQQKMTAVSAAPVMQARAEATQARAVDNRVLMYAAIGGLVLFMVTRK